MTIDRGCNILFWGQQLNFYTFSNKTFVCMDMYVAKRKILRIL